MSESDQEQELRRVSMSSQTEYVSANQIQLLCSRPPLPQQREQVSASQVDFAHLLAKENITQRSGPRSLLAQRQTTASFDFVIAQSLLLYIEGRNREEAFHALLEIL